MVELTSEQLAARSAILNALNNGREIFTLHGLAGTGKTTVVSDLARRDHAMLLCTLTGKAASVLSTKTGLPAQTIHSVFYQLIGKGKDSRGRKQLKWKEKLRANSLSRCVLLLDECSMIDERMAGDILRTGVSIVACGDPGQLPPVKGRQFFDSADFTLQTIHRQAADNPIIAQAWRVRQGGTYEACGEQVRVQVRGSEEDMLGADIVLCWTNRTRDKANHRLRAMKGIWSASPQVGEPVICLKNNSEFGLFNGQIYTLAQPFYDGDTQITLDVDGQEVTIRNSKFRGVSSLLDPDEELDGYFDFGYCITVHKSQGSEWNSVVLIDEYPVGREDRARWLYTGITRAAKRLLVLGNGK